MATTERRDLTLADSLSEVTRKERKLLLGTSAVAFLVVQTRLMG